MQGGLHHPKISRIEVSEKILDGIRNFFDRDSRATYILFVSTEMLTHGHGVSAWRCCEKEMS